MVVREWMLVVLFGGREDICVRYSLRGGGGVSL